MEPLQCPTSTHFLVGGGLTRTLITSWSNSNWGSNTFNRSVLNTDWYNAGDYIEILVRLQISEYGKKERYTSDSFYFDKSELLTWYNYTSTTRAFGPNIIFKSTSSSTGLSGGPIFEYGNINYGGNKVGIHIETFQYSGSVENFYVYLYSLKF